MNETFHKPYEIFVFGAKNGTKNRNWVNWASSEMLSAQWKVSQRRVQQILKAMDEKEELEVGVIVLDIGSTNPISKPIYKMLWSVQK